MYKVFTKSSSYKLCGQSYFMLLNGDANRAVNLIHITSASKFPQVTRLQLPTNVVDINASEMAIFSPMRERDVSGPVISSYYDKNDKTPCQIDITVQADQHLNKYDCRGAVSLSSSMQSNVPSPFSGNHTHLEMPGSQWGQGYKYLSDHLHGAHYLTLRNEYRENIFSKATIATRNMTTETNSQNISKSVSAKEKLKRAVKEYGSTVIVFHVSISLLSLGSCYLLVSSGIDLVSLLEKINIGEGTVSKIINSNAGTFVVAYAVHKVFAPVRMAITLTATPFIVRYLRNIGFLKVNIKSGDGK